MVTRYHALDNLRAILMLLGVVLHAACSYVTFPLRDGWPFKDTAAVSPMFDLVIAVIHAFRMPLFFVIAGFFAHLLYERRGIGGLLRNRAKRILVPFVVGWLVLYVPTFLAFAWSLGGRLALVNTTMHLWFLNDLLWFYAATAIAPVAPASAHNGFQRLMASPLRTVFMAIPTAAVLWFMKTGVFDGSTTLIPEPRTLIAYGLFYWFGWMLWRQRDLLDSLTRFAAAQTVAGFALVPVMLAAVIKAGAPPIAKNTPEHLIAIVAGALSVWLLIFGLTGLCLKYLHHTHSRMNYLSNASYWIYLAHLPVVIWMAVLLRPWQVSGLLKFPLIVGSTTAMLLVSYELLVRKTFIGEYLNGSAGK